MNFLTRQLRTLLLSAAVLLSLSLALSSCDGDKGTGSSGDESAIKGTFTDSRDGKTYKTVKIGSQRWMAENLNIETEESWCYGEDGQEARLDEYSDLIFRTLSYDEIQDNCNKYGRLYTWTAAKKACPMGWHLPSRAEWGALAIAAGGTDYGIEGTALKSISGWNNLSDGSSGNGTDEYGFSALPGGRRSPGNPGNIFDLVGKYGGWWTATESGGDAYYRELVYNYLSDGGAAKFCGLSVRCIAD